MSTYPHALKKLIPPGANDPRITATQVILHVAVSESPSLHAYFNGPSGGIESHFYIRRDGTVEQYRDTDFEADANHTANSRAISIETQGMGAGEWTPEQVAAIKDLLLWARDTHGIPLRKCPTHDAPGVGYHVMFGAPGPWTPVAKSCPGPDRVRQFERVIVPWLASTPTLSTRAALSEEDDMPSAEEIADAVWKRSIPMGKDKPIPAQALLRQARNQSSASKVDPAALAAAVVAALPAGKVDQATVEAGVLSALRKLVNEE